MKVSKAIKDAYTADRKDIDLKISISGIGTLTASDCKTESLELTESIMDSDVLEFGGCISSSFSIIAYNIANVDVTGKTISVKIRADKTKETDWINLFNGVIESVKLQNDKMSKKITAYDKLHELSDVDISSFYNGLTFPITVKNFRNSLFSHLGINQKTKTLPNDSVELQKQDVKNQLVAMDVVKNICRINGMFGIINRDNYFEYRSLKADSESNLYPAATLYPKSSLYPGRGEGGSGEGARTQTIPVYRSFSYEEFYVEKINAVSIRKSESDQGVKVGSGTNCYVLTNDFLLSNLEESVLTTVATNLFEEIEDIRYVPFKSEHIGLPFVECGEEIWFTSYTGEIKSFPVLSRKLNGIQSLKDSCSAKGTKYQPGVSYKQDSPASNKDVDDKIEDVKDNMLKAVACKDNPPEQMEENTIYFIYYEE